MSKVSEASNTKKSRTPELLCNVFALRRSGHHAVIAWLTDCYAANDKLAVHVNESESIGHVADDSDPDWEVFTAGKLLDAVAQEQNCTTLIVNYEDIAYSDRERILAYRDPLWANLGVKTIDMLVIRDWYNLVASRVKKIENDKLNNDYPLLEVQSWEDIARIWIEQAELALSTDQDKPLVIKYNQWCSSKDYRNSIASSLGLPNKDASIRNVPLFGNGSSFDGLTLQGKADEMDTAKRWSQLDQHLTLKFHKVIDGVYRDKIDELNRSLFGFSRAEIASTQANKKLH